MKETKTCMSEDYSQFITGLNYNFVSSKTGQGSSICHTISFSFVYIIRERKEGIRADGNFPKFVKPFLLLIFG